MKKRRNNLPKQELIRVAETTVDMASFVLQGFALIVLLIIGLSVLASWLGEGSDELPDAHSTYYPLHFSDEEQPQIHSR